MSFSFILQFLAVVHISRVNCNEMAGDRLRQCSSYLFDIHHHLSLSLSQKAEVMKMMDMKKQDMNIS